MPSQLGRDFSRELLWLPSIRTTWKSSLLLWPRLWQLQVQTPRSGLGTQFSPCKSCRELWFGVQLSDNNVPFGTYRLNTHGDMFIKEFYSAGHRKDQETQARRLDIFPDILLFNFDSSSWTSPLPLIILSCFLVSTSDPCSPSTSAVRQVPLTPTLDF